jgi:hypothetical protein
LKKLSSDWTFVYRGIYPIFFGGMTALVFLSSLFGELRDRDNIAAPWWVKWTILTVGGAGTAAAIMQARLIQEVEMDDVQIKISGSRGIEEIPLTRIRSVDETRLRNPKLVIVYVFPECRYGPTVRFIPKGRGVLFGEHPIVSRIKRALTMLPARR